jgi:hypothetical protein
MSGPADALRRKLSGGKPDTADALRKLLSGETDEPAPQWYDLAIEYDRRSDEILAEQKAAKAAAEEAAAASGMSAAQALRAAIHGAGMSSPHLALNSAELLKRALSGPGTVNGGTGD